MEKYIASVRFCIICNRLNKIIPAIQSRCTKFRIGRLNTESILKNLIKISECEKYSIQL